MCSYIELGQEPMLLHEIIKMGTYVEVLTCREKK
jgi:hypothetical protein